MKTEFSTCRECLYPKDTNRHSFLGPLSKVDPKHSWDNPWPWGDKTFLRYRNYVPPPHNLWWISRTKPLRFLFSFFFCGVFSYPISLVVVQSLSHVRLFVTPWTAACQAFLSSTISQIANSLLKLMSIESVMPSHPLSPPSPPALNLFQHQDLFQWVFSSLATWILWASAKTVNSFKAGACHLHL